MEYRQFMYTLNIYKQKYYRLFTDGIGQGVSSRGMPEEMVIQVKGELHYTLAQLTTLLSNELTVSVIRIAPTFTVVQLHSATCDVPFPTRPTLQLISYQFHLNVTIMRDISKTLY